jgi:hypothetical protein
MLAEQVDLDLINQKLQFQLVFAESFDSRHHPSDVGGSLDDLPRLRLTQLPDHPELYLTASLRLHLPHHLQGLVETGNLRFVWLLLLPAEIFLRPVQLEVYLDIGVLAFELLELRWTGSEGKRVLFVGRTFGYADGRLCVGGSRLYGDFDAEVGLRGGLSGVGVMGWRGGRCVLGFDADTSYDRLVETTALVYLFYSVHCLFGVGTVGH